MSNTRNEERCRARIEHLRDLIADIPSPEEDIPDDEERKILKAIANVERIHNQRNDARKVFRVAAEVHDKKKRIGATIDATIKVNANPNRIDLNNEAILISFLVKGREIRTQTSLAGEINIDEFENIEIEMSEPSREQEFEPVAGPETVVTAEIYQDPTEEDATSIKNHPEVIVEARANANIL